MTDLPRVELQAELGLARPRVWPLLATAAGLARWLDGAELEASVGGAVRLRLLEATVAGTVLAFDPPQHLSFTWDYPDDPLGYPTVVAFDAIEHGPRTHLTVRHVGFRSERQRLLHDALWRVWFERLRAAAESAGLIGSG
ncbi:MAG: SRPBCC family protein [Candidatus Limnocylindrales bacterium]